MISALLLNGFLLRLQGDIKVSCYCKNYIQRQAAAVKSKLDHYVSLLSVRYTFTRPWQLTLNCCCFSDLSLISVCYEVRT